MSEIAEGGGELLSHCHCGTGSNRSRNRMDEVHARARFKAMCRKGSGVAERPPLKGVATRPFWAI